MPRKSKGGLGNGLDNLLGSNPLAKKKEQGVLSLPIQDIHPNPEQPRRTFHEDDMSTLSASIREYGVVQPIVVVKQDTGYQIVAGERRWRASQLAGKDTIPAIVKDYSLEEITEIALIENLQRRDLDPMEEAYAYKKLQDTFKQTQDMMATRLGRSRSHVANMMRLLQLPAWLQEEVSLGELSVGQVRPLIPLKKEALQRDIVARIKEQDLNARQVELLVKQVQQPKKKVAEKPEETAEVRALVDRLRFTLGTPVSIKLKPGKETKGSLVLSFNSEDELNRLLAHIEQEG